MQRPRTHFKEVRFHNPRLTRVGVDVIDLDELRGRAGAALASPERPVFYMLLLVHRGEGRHMVDFVEHRIKAGDVLFVRPGQVQHWRLHKSLNADVVLASPEALAPFVARADVGDMKVLGLDEWPATLRPREDSFLQARAAVATLRADTRGFDGSALEASLIWHQLLALFLRLAKSRATRSHLATTTESEVHRLFLRELDKNLDRRTTVRAVASKLGYSESTLTRACLAVSERTPKQLLDDRVVLEAKRLLVHSSATVGQIADALGFSEPTNFVKFFRRVARVSPIEFRMRNLPS
jgi:AraC-like DNA-binding protein